MKPTKATLQKRLEEILELRLSGATFFDARRYLAEKEAASEEPWSIPDGGRPVSERTLWRYFQQTDRMIAESCRESRKRLLRWHRAKRNRLFSRCVEQADYRAALACLADEAKLLGLYPAAKSELTGARGTPIILQIVEQVSGPEAAEMLGAIREEVITSGDSKPGGPDDPATPGSDGIPAI